MDERRSTQLFKINNETTPLIPDIQPEVRYRSFSDSFGSGLIIALSGVFIGYTLSQVSPILGPTYIQFWNVNFSQDAIMIIMVGIPTITAILGASMTKFTLAHLSRKNSLVVAAVGVIVSSCIMVIPYPESLMIGRILEGVAVGFAMGITSIYLRQISPKQLRSIIMPLIAVGITLGSTITYVISQIMEHSNFGPQGQARVLLLFNAVFGLIQLIANLAYLPDSPHERIGKGFEEQGRAILAKIYKDKYVEEELADIKKDLASAKKTQDAADMNESQRDPDQLKLLQKANKARAVAIFISIFRNLSGGYIILVYIGPIISAIYGGQYLVPPSPYAYLFGLTPLVCTILAFIGNVIGVFALSTVFGRKTLLTVAAIGLLITNVVCAATLQTKQLWPFFAFCLLQMVFYGMFSLAPGWTYPNQVVSADRVALQNTLNTISMVIAVFLSPIVTAFAPGHLAYPLFYASAGINLIAVFIFSFIMIESKGLTYHEIIEKY